MYDPCTNAGKNAIGQIRSAVIPYALSCLFRMSEGSDGNVRFNLPRIWKEEGLSEEFREFLRELLFLVNDLIKKYSLSDDLGEYSKKPELSGAIRTSPELESFVQSEDTQNVLADYLIPVAQPEREELDKR